MISIDGKLSYFNNPHKDSAAIYPDELKSIASLQKSDVALAALITARNSPEISKQLALDARSHIFILGTEGATDPELYQRLIKG